MVSMGDFKMLQPPSSVWHRGAGEMAQLYTTGQGAPLNFNAGFAANIADEPYAVAPGSNFRWFRSRVIGGRTNHYSRVQLRYADYDFKPHDYDGIGWNWPISYQDIAPYYDKAERLIGVTGKAEGIRSAPDGIFQTPAALKPGEILVQKGCAKLGIRAINARQAVLTKAQDGRAGVPLLRPVHARLRDGVQLRVELRADLPGDEDGQRHRRRQRDGARADHRRLRQGHGGVLRRQADRHGAAGAVPHRGAVGVGVRVGAPAAQLEVAAASAGPRQRERPGRQVPHRHGRLRHVGAGPGAGRHAGLQLGRLRRASLHPVVDARAPQGAGLPARLPRRGRRRRLRHARPGLRRRHLQPHRGLRPADEEGDPRELRRHDRQPQRPRRDGPERGLLLRDRSRPEGQVGDPGAALPLEVERLRDQPGEAHARVVPRDPRDDRRHGEPAAAVRAAGRGAGRRLRGRCDDSGVDFNSGVDCAARWAPAAA